MTLVDNPITEEWKGLHGYHNYNAIPTEQAAQLRKQNHVNIRSFYGDATTQSVASRDVYMLFMDSMTMQDLNNLKMSVLGGSLTVREGEQWTRGEWQRDPTRKNWNVLTVSCEADTPTLSASIVID